MRRNICQRVAPSSVITSYSIHYTKLYEVLPVGVLVFPGTGIQENLADKAKKLGIPVMKFERGA